jgi:HAD superfamily hydrolase (TIGR01450 family)
MCEHSAMKPQPDLRSQLAGVRGLLLDLDGVLILRNEPIPGVKEALARLDAAGMPYLLATNMSLVGRATLSRQLAVAGLAIPPERILSASSAAAAYTRRRFPGRPLYVMVAPDALAEFEGQRLLSYDEAAAPGAGAAAVVVGDAGDDFTAANMQSAFTLLRGGAGFVAMHKNRWWITPAGVTLDSGAYVAALEFGLQRRALVTGKPARAFFAEGVRQLAEIVEAHNGDGAPRRAGSGTGTKAAGPARLAAHEVAMVGDDVWNDIRGAQKAGLRGIFVHSGKHGEPELARVAGERDGRAPDAMAPSLVEIAAALTD